MSKVLESIERMLKAPGNGTQELLYFHKLNPSLRSLGQCFIAFMRYDQKYIDLVNPQDTLDLAFAYYLAAFETFYHSKMKISYHCLTFEELIENPRTFIEKVFALVEIDPKYVGNAVDAMQKDSQMGTVLSQAKMKRIETTPLTDMKRNRYNDLCILFDVPVLFD